MVAVLSATLLIQLVVVSSLQHSAAQERSFDSFRGKLAQGTAPIGPTDADGEPLALGTPIAYLEIPEIGLVQVVAEGTTADVLFDAPGHRRDTPLPGQIGTSVVFGRRSWFGGPFGRINELEADDEIKVTTGQGEFVFRVLGVRAEGDPAPALPESGAGRLLLATAAGSPFLPDGVLRVDAELEGAAVVGAARVVTAAGLPADERMMAGDTSTLWALALWIQVMIVLDRSVPSGRGTDGVASRHGWSFCPALVLDGLSAAGEVARLLPNLS